jgi:hypothetical protein
MPLNTTPELPPSGDRLKVPKRLVMDSGSPEWVVDVLGGPDAEQKICLAGGDGGFT